MADCNGCGDLTVRKARISDWDEVKDLWIDSRDYHVGLSDREWLLTDDYMDVWKKWHSRNIRSRNFSAYVAILDGRIVGSAAGVLIRGSEDLVHRDEAYLSVIFIDEKHRGKGIGTKLMDTFIEWAKEKGVRYVTLDVIPENKPGLDLYDKYRFETLTLKKRLILE